MTAEGHIIFAITSCIIIKNSSLISTLNNIDLWHLLPTVIIASLLPDIDHPKSIIGKNFKFISKFIYSSCGHRGFTHSLLIIIIFWFFQNSEYYHIPYDINQGIMFGYISHIFSDVFTPAGVPLFWPLRLRIRIPIIISNNNNKRERVFCFVLICYVLLFSMNIFNINKKDLCFNLLFNKVKKIFSQTNTY